MSSKTSKLSQSFWESFDPRMSTSSYHTLEIPEVRRVSDLDIRQSFDILNKRTIELDTALSKTLDIIKTLQDKVLEQDEMIEYLKDVANKEI